MAGSSLAWVGYNFFRFVALVFMVWAIIAQFMILADDIGRYNAFQANSTSALAQSASGGASSITSKTISGGSTESLIRATLGSGSTPAAGPAILQTGTSTFNANGGVGLGTATGATGMIVSPTDGVESAGMTEDGTRLGQRPRRRIYRRTSGNLQTRDIDNNGMEVKVLDMTYFQVGGIPNQPGGIAFNVFSRIFIAGAFVILIAAQLGVPETLLYKHLSWLGPQSTTMCLGCVQLLLATENLRSFAKPINLIPAWGILGIGSVNILLSLTFIWIARELPKIPPPPLYFHQSVRLFPTRPLPDFYRQLYETPAPVDPEYDVEDQMQQQEHLPVSNSEDLGMELDLDPDYGGVEKGRKASEEYHYESRPGTVVQSKEARLTPVEQLEARTRRAGERLQREMSLANKLRGRGLDKAEPDVPTRDAILGVTAHGLATHQDVTQGGYPTFSGGGMMDVGRQVPTGVIEKGSDGKAIRFVKDDGGGVGKTGRQDEAHPEIETTRPSEGSKKRDDNERSRSRSRSEKESRSRGTNETARSTKDSEKREGRKRDNVKELKSDPTSHEEQKKSKSNKGVDIKDIKVPEIPQNQEVPSRPVSSLSTRSVTVASAELGPRFPTPPVRSRTLDTLGQRESTVTLGGPAGLQNKAQAPSSTRDKQLPKAPSKSATLPLPPISAIPEEEEPKSPKDAYGGYESVPQQKIRSLEPQQPRKKEESRRERRDVSPSNLRSHSPHTPMTAKSSLGDSSSPYDSEVGVEQPKATVVKLSSAQSRSLPDNTKNRKVKEPKRDTQIDKKPNREGKNDTSAPASVIPSKEYTRPQPTRINTKVSSQPDIVSSASQRRRSRSDPPPVGAGLRRASSLKSAMTPSPASSSPGSDAPPKLEPKGVRFDLASVEEVSEPESAVPSLLSPQPPASAGIRIPGTSYTLSMPSLFSNGSNPQRERRNSTGSIASTRSSRSYSSDGLESPRGAGRDSLLQYRNPAVTPGIRDQSSPADSPALTGVSNTPDSPMTAQNQQSKMMEFMRSGNMKQSVKGSKEGAALPSRPISEFVLGAEYLGGGSELETRRKSSVGA